MKHKHFKTLLLASLLAYSSSLSAQTISFLGKDVEATSVNDYTYVAYSYMPQTKTTHKNQLCVPLNGHLVFAMPHEEEWQVPVRALGTTYNYKFQDGKLEVSYPRNPQITTHDYVEVSYDYIKNLSYFDSICATIKTSYWDTTTKQIKSREDKVWLKSEEQRPLQEFQNMISREVIEVTGITDEPITYKGDDGYIDKQAIFSYFKKLGQTIYDIFPEYYPEYTITATGEIVKVTAKRGSSYTILHDNDETEVIQSSRVRMCRTNRINSDPVSEKEVLEFINTKAYTSPTDYLVFTDISRQYTHVLKKVNGEWTVLKSILSSTGLNATPTPTGLYHLTKKVPYFGVEKGYRCKNAVGFIGGTYLYHSTIFNKAGTKLLEGKGVLGTQASQGCIRFSPEEAEWFYNTLPLNSTVVIR